MADKKNFLKYSSLTYQNIIDQVNARLAADSRFDNFRESAIAQTMVEIFAGCVDINNFYIERRAEESYFDTARLKSSIIMLARQLGYVVKRPVPAEANIKFEIAPGLAAELINPGDLIQIPFQRVFTYKGNKFIAKNGFSYKITQDDLTALGNGQTVTVTLDSNGNDMTLVQGEIKEKLIEGANNPQVGQKFQIYRVDDEKFSNRYGDQDFTVPVTKIWVGNEKSDDTEYTIDRRSLINWESIESFNANTDSTVCVVRTSISEEVEVLFGDAQFASLGPNISAANTPNTSFDNVYIQYLATEGTAANQVGVINEKVNFADKILIGSTDITGYIKFLFKTNITGGADMEDIESIKLNAPEIYYSLDRLVTTRDYVAYLKSLTSPIVVQDAIAWGEQEEIIKRKERAIVDLFNVVLFSCIGGLYNLDGDEATATWTPRTRESGLYKSVLDDDYDEYRYTDQSYYNVYVRGDEGANVVRQLRNYENVDTSGSFKRIRSGDLWNIQTLVAAQDNDFPLFTSGYSNSAVMNLKYSSTQSDNLANVVGISAVTVDINVTTFSAFAENLQTAIRKVVDARVGGKGTSGFENTVVTFSAGTPNTSERSNIIIDGGIDDDLYISAIYDSTNGGFFEGVRLTTTKWSSDLFVYSATGDTREISKGIKDLVDDLDTRSQVTIRNIYITPVIQTMDLSGTVYINQLEDKEDMKRQINNALYKWADENLDFNTPIYYSNVVEVIEQFPGVLYTDMEIVPQTVSKPDETNWWLGLSDPRTSDPTIYYSIVGNGALTDYLSAGSERNERRFYEVFVKGAYDNLGNSTIGSEFRDTDTFRDVIADIRKDTLEDIKDSMFETVIDGSPLVTSAGGPTGEIKPVPNYRGNIVQQTDDRGNHVRGGYSVGYEIVKINSELVYAYKT